MSSSSSSSVLSSFFASPQFLRRVLWLDAASGVGTALLQCEFADTLAPLLGLPANLLLWSGYLLGAFVLGIVWIATRRTIPAGPVWLLIAVNAVWVLGCLGLLASSAVVPTVWGEVFLVVQAVFVGVLVELEWIGVRKIQPEPAW